MIRPAVALVLLPTIQSLGAQCTTTWGPAFGLPGVATTVRATTMWDPDGAGPAAPLLVVGGNISAAGAAAVGNVATYDPVGRTWAALGQPGGNVNALAVLPNGDLVAGGDMRQVVRWTGGAWVSLGSSHNGIVRALAVLPNGDLVAGGEFTSIGGVSASNIAVWNGTWAALGAGVSGGTWPDQGVHSLAVLANGDLVAGGYFTTAGGLAASSIAQWNGAAWSALGAGVSGGTYGSFVRALLTLPGGGLVAAGTFGLAGGLAVNSVATWNGASWAPFGSLGDHVYMLLRTANGTIYAAGAFANSFARWSGSAWIAIPGLPNFPSVLSMTELPGGELALGGALLAPFHGLVRWNGSTFAVPNPGFGQASVGLSIVNAVAALPSGDAVVGGLFASIAGVAANHVARWDGTAWHALGSGTDGGGVSALLVLPNGDLVVAGGFATAGGVSANNIARWNGSAFAPLGGGTDGPIYALCRLPNGDLVAGGFFSMAGGLPAQRIARWNGSTWTPLGAGVNGVVQALAALPNGDVAAAGTLAAGGGATAVARWNGAAWSTIGAFSTPPSPFNPSPSSYVWSMRTAANGDLLAGGYFELAGAVPASGIARWNGAVWSGLGAGTGGTYALFELPDGDVLAGGLYGIAGSSGTLARWNGSSWTGLGGEGHQTVLGLALTAGGTLVLGGNATAGTPSAFFATKVSTCPASAGPSGNGCTGAAGPLAMAVTSLSWTGGRFGARSTGIPAGGLALAVSGFGNPATPIVQLTPLGVAGCDLLVTLDAWMLVVPVGGVAVAELAIPDSVVLAGVLFRHQHLVLELDPSAQLRGITSTNALQLTVGTF